MVINYACKSVLIVTKWKDGKDSVILKVTEYWEVALFCGPAHHIWDSIYWFPGTGQCTSYKL